MRILRGFVGLGVLAAVVSTVAPAGAHDCGCGGTQTFCTINCSASNLESEVRSAVAALNVCSPGTGSKEIRFNNCPANKVILMQQIDTAPTSSCGTATNGVCVYGTGITIDGSDSTGVGKVTFEYSGGGGCCEDACGTFAKLFTVRGNNNTLRDFKTRYFPDGMNIERGDNHVVTGIESDRYCDDVVGVDVTAGTGIVISNSFFTGHTSDPKCQNSVCGSGKAVQINGGVVSLTNNDFFGASYPVKISGVNAGGKHLINSNRVTGSASDANQCQSLAVGDLNGSAPEIKAEFTGNTIKWCKFGVQLLTEGTRPKHVEVFNNRFEDNFNTALYVSPGSQTALLKGQGNLFIATRPSSDAILRVDNAAARIDLGSGDESNNCVLPADASCVRSQGRNSFCRSAGYDVRETASASTGAQGNCWGDEGSPDALIQGTVAIGTLASCATAGFTPCGPSVPTSTSTPAPPTPTWTLSGPTRTSTNTPLPTATPTRTSTRTVTNTPSNTPTPCATGTPCPAGQSRVCSDQQGCSCSCQVNTPTATRTVTNTATATPCFTGTPCAMNETRLCPPGAPPNDACLCSCATHTPTPTPT